MKVYNNGDLVAAESLKELLEPGFLFGWGAFEALRVYNKKALFLDLHTERLNKSLGLVGIGQVNLDFQKIIDELLKVNNLDDAYLRITCYKKRNSTGIIIYAAKFSYYSASTYDKGFSAIISPYSFNTKDIFWKAKSLSYLEKRLSWYEAQKVKKDEALVRNLEGFVIGGARSNLFLIKNNKVIIPSSESGIFEGITASFVLKILNNLGIDVVEEKINLDTIYSCNEAFLSSSLLEVMPLIECDNRILGKGHPGELTLKILSEYRKIIND